MKFKLKFFCAILTVMLLIPNTFTFAQNIDVNDYSTMSFEQLSKNNNSWETNELLEIKKNKLKSPCQLRSAGFDNERIQKIEEFSISGLFDKYSEADFYQMGYNKQDINLLKKYKDTEFVNIPDNVLARSGARARVSLDKSSYHVGKDYTTAAVTAKWAWNKAPFCAGQDGLGFEWGGNFSTDVNDSSVKVEWVNRNGGLMDRATYDVDKHAPNKGCGFSWSQGSHLGITQGVAVVHISNYNGQVKDFEVTVDYLHSTKSSSWSFCWPLGVCVSQTSGLSKMDHKRVRFR
ncbi:hypothetical protein IZY60_13600 [Lutibacter sp. B2]|nr:hypothetical protein [Lutibacter sp. B2]